MYRMAHRVIKASSLGLHMFNVLLSWVVVALLMMECTREANILTYPTECAYENFEISEGRNTHRKGEKQNTQMWGKKQRNSSYVCLCSMEPELASLFFFYYVAHLRDLCNLKCASLHCFSRKKIPEKNNTRKSNCFDVMNTVCVYNVVFRMK